MMFANYAAEHFLGKKKRKQHKKVIGEGLRLELIRKQAGGWIWMWPFVCRTQQRERRTGKKKAKENKNSKGQFPVKDFVSDVINLLI